MIRRVLSLLLGRTVSEAQPRARKPTATDAGRRIEIAQRRLKATIPPPED